MGPFFQIPDPIRDCIRAGIQRFDGLDVLWVLLTGHMRFLLGVEGDIEGDVVIAGDDELEFGRVGAEEGDGEKVFKMEARGGKVAGMDEDVCVGEGAVKGDILVR
jgi:hypothetical protein